MKIIICVHGVLGFVASVSRPTEQWACIDHMATDCATWRIITDNVQENTVANYVQI